MRERNMLVIDVNVEEDAKRAHKVIPVTMGGIIITRNEEARPR
jgi:hypothetical protein